MSILGDLRGVAKTLHQLSDGYLIAQGVLKCAGLLDGNRSLLIARLKIAAQTLELLGHNHADILAQLGHTLRLGRVGGIILEQHAVVLYLSPTAAGSHHHRLNRTAINKRPPCINIAACLFLSTRLVIVVMAYCTTEIGRASCREGMQNWVVGG